MRGTVQANKHQNRKAVSLRIAQADQKRQRKKQDKAHIIPPIPQKQRQEQGQGI